jgi:hypothetical protein
MVHPVSGSVAHHPSARFVSIELRGRHGEGVDHPATVIDLDGPSGQDWREVAEDYREGEDGEEEELVAAMVVGSEVQFWFRGTTHSTLGNADQT